MADRPRPPHPWELPPENRPLPGNPYATESFGPPVEPGRPARSGQGKSKSKVPLIAAAVVLLLLVAGGGVYAVTDGRWGGSAAPGAPAAKEKTPTPAETPSISGTPSAPPSPSVGTPEPKRIPTSEEINAGRAPGDATAWVVDDPTDLPGRNILLHDLWIVGDTVVQAMHRKVTAYRLSDGAEVWSVPLPAPVCETPVNPTPDGKVVVVYKNSQAHSGNRCNQLQMIDLRTGKAGWQKELTEASRGDTIIVHTAISGDVLAVVQGMKAAAYGVDDGKKLYDIPMENPGRCYPDDVAGGPRLLLHSTCAISADRGKTYSQLREIVPRTGKVRWRHRTKAGWTVGKVISVAPAVFTTRDVEDRINNWRIAVLGPGGKLRTTIDARPKGFAYCGDSGDSGQGIQNCPGMIVGKNAVHVGGTAQVGAYDLSTGKFVWGVKSEESTLHPLREENGTFAHVYERSLPGREGGIIRLGPGGVETKKQVLLHPQSARATESGMFAGRLAYVKDRIVITPSIVDGEDTRREARMISFAPGSP
ncbi:PQQ-binding-like beta-propeller repeat protein [Streptomyces sp. NPDC059452]|uniref:outer membrane protein assembly factor BamB family protein n=1 Tax=Streptomyces sp. NPDC059452 TaxID=3346835 RepID=UPI0036C0BC62